MWQPPHTNQGRQVEYRRIRWQYESRCKSKAPRQRLTDNEQQRPVSRWVLVRWGAGRPRTQAENARTRNCNCFRRHWKARLVAIGTRWRVLARQLCPTVQVPRGRSGATRVGCLVWWFDFSRLSKLEYSRPLRPVPWPFVVWWPRSAQQQLRLLKSVSNLLLFLPTFSFCPSFSSTSKKPSHLMT